MSFLSIRWQIEQYLDGGVIELNDFFGIWGLLGGICQDIRSINQKTELVDHISESFVPSSFFVSESMSKRLRSTVFDSLV